MGAHPYLLIAGLAALIVILFIADQIIICAKERHERDDDWDGSDG
jgi:hypothetical protein